MLVCCIFSLHVLMFNLSHDLLNMFISITHLDGNEIMEHMNLRRKHNLRKIYLGMKYGFTPHVSIYNKS